MVGQCRTFPRIGLAFAMATLVGCFPQKNNSDDGSPAPGDLAAPSNLVVTVVNATSVYLTWHDNSSDEDGFDVERGFTATTFFLLHSLPANTTLMFDSGLASGIAYTYRVRARRGSTYSAYSNIASNAPSTGSTFADIYTSPATEEVRWASANSDSGCIVSANQFPNHLVARFDGQGTLLWAQAASINTQSFAGAAIPTLFGDIAAVGSNVFSSPNVPVPPNSNGHVLRYNSQGALLWTRLVTVSNSTVTSLTHVATAATAGDLLIGGTTIPSGTVSGDILLARITMAGAPIWSRVFDGGASEVLAGLTSTFDGGCAFVALSEAINSKTILVGKVDGQGQLQWVRRIYGIAIDSVTGISEAPDNGLVIGGATAWVAPTNGDYMVIKVDSQGNLLWSKSFGSASNERVTGISVSPDGSILVTGEMWIGNDEAIVASLTPQGDLTWARRFTGPSQERLMRAFSVIGGGILAAGDSDSYGGTGTRNLVVIKFTDQGATSAVNSVQPIALNGGVLGFAQTNAFLVAQNVAVALTAITPATQSAGFTAGALP